MAVNPHSLNQVDPDLRSAQIADWLAANPSAIEEALQVLDRWQQWGRTHPAGISVWRRRLTAAQGSPEGFEALLSYLRTPNHDSEPLKSCSPLSAIFPVQP